MTTALAAVKQARRAIGEVGARLLDPTPQTVAACLEPLAAAIACMTDVQTFLSGQPNGPENPALRRQLTSLRSEVRQAAVLLRAAGAFYEGYGRLIGCGQDESAENYGPDYRDGYRGMRRIATPTHSRGLEIHG